MIDTEKLWLDKGGYGFPLIVQIVAEPDNGRVWVQIYYDPDGEFSVGSSYSTKKSCLDDNPLEVLAWMAE